MKRIGYLKAFCRNGRIIIANSEELNLLLKDKNDYMMILPFFMNTEDVQIREIDVEEFKTLTPNNILSSPFEPRFEDIESTHEQPLFLNSKPFSAKKLKEGVDKINKLLMGGIADLFGL